MAITEAHQDWLALTLVPGVGTAVFIRLLARFRTPANVLSASCGELREVVGPKLAERISQYGDMVDVGAQERALKEYGVELVTLEDPEYPLHLAEIYDPPLVLFVRGELREEDQYSVGIVGTRRPTPYGVRMAEQFARELALRGITVISGMALGVDAAAHRGALDAGGRTIAVLGCGVDVVYPRQHDELMHRIAQSGAVISQFPMGTKPSAGHFPYRNRIISGMSLGTLIVEAPLKSGALITARHASEQGREVFAVPGQVGVANSEGPHALIREGAKLVESVDEILVELQLPAELRQQEAATVSVAAAPVSVERRAPATAARPRVEERPAAPHSAAPSRPAAPMDLNPSERAVLSALAADGSHVDEISQACRLSISEALSTLTLLELKGMVRQFSGKRFAPR